MWFIALALVMACIPALSANPPVPTIDPNVIGTYIAQTANAANSQTAVALPTLTPTVTSTPTPRNTASPEPSATNTVIYIFPTSTRAIVPTVTGSNGATSSNKYDCQVLSVTPANGTFFNARTDFDARWKVINIGQSEWDGNTVDYVYLSGDQFHKVAGYDLGKTVNKGETRELIVDMVAPKKPGTYTTTWTLRAGNQSFCALTLTINVK